MLFTDLVGSTEQRQQLGDEEGNALRRTHDALLREQIARTGGYEVKHTGDGLMVTFTSAVDALNCAKKIQQSVHRHNERLEDERRLLSVRVGVHVGEPEQEDGDYFGSAVDIAKRLCDSAEGGQIVVSDLVRGLVGSRGDHAFESLGGLTLKGIAEPLPASSVFWEPAPADADDQLELEGPAGQLPLPQLLATYEPASFVGREEELSELETCWEQVRSGQRRLFLLAGDPGIGKTRLAAQFARKAHEEGAAVLLGQCDEEALITYQPFVEALHHVVLSTPGPALRAQVGKNGGVLARLLPELARRLPDLAPSTAESGAGAMQGDPESDRYWFFEAIASLLMELSRDRPLLIILDDLHWADKPTLLLLKHIMRAPEQSPVLLLGTYRESDLGRTHPLADTLADLRRIRAFEKRPLQGLTDGDIQRMVATWAGHAVPPALVEAITARTLGNPFFVQEVLANLSETGVMSGPERELAARLAKLLEEHGIPEGIKEVVGRRLTRLSEPCNATLALASVAGREFELPVLERVSELSGDQILDALDEAAAARLIAETARTGRYAFSHPLTRETLYGELSSARRVRMHRRIGEALEDLAQGDEDAYLSELAYHFFRAAGERSDIDKTVAYARRAGDRARSLYAYEESVNHYERALQALELNEDAEETDRFDLLLSLGNCIRLTGDSRRATETIEEALELARKLGDAQLLAKAVLSLRVGYLELGIGGVDEYYVGLLEEALAALGDEDSALRAGLLGFLAGEYYISPDEGKRLSLSEQAVEVARRAGDPDQLAFTLIVRHQCIRGPEHAEERAAAAGEILELANQTGSDELALSGYSSRIEDLLELGDIGAVDEAIDVRARLAAESRVHRHVLHSRQLDAMRALLAGRFDEAERAANEALVLGQRSRSRTALAMYSIQMFLLRKEQGRLKEIEEPHRALADRYGDIPAYRCALALLYAELGKPDAAREQVELLAGDGFQAIPRDTTWLMCIVYLAEACSLLREETRAAQLHELLLPHDGYNVVVGYATACFGPAARYLGLLATSRERWEQAERHFQDSAAMSRRMGTQPWLAHTLTDHARMLARSGRGDQTTPLLDQALDIAERLSMLSLAEQARSLKNGE